MYMTCRGYFHCDPVGNSGKAAYGLVLELSTARNSQHANNCPKGKNSWFTWQKAKTNEKLHKYKHKPEMSLVVTGSVRPVYDDLSRDDFFERCVGAFSQNNNKSLNALP